MAIPVLHSDRETRLAAARKSAQRLLDQFDELGLSLAAAYLSMSLEMIAVDGRARERSL